MNKRKEELYIQDILSAITNIEKYTKDVSFKSFAGNQMIVDAVVRNFEIIGEAAKHLSKETKLSLSEIPWQDVTGMRNKMVHEYFGIDLEIIWETIQTSLPGFKKALKKSKKK